MRKTARYLLIPFIAFAVMFQNTNAQTLEETLGDLSSAATEAYVSPIISAFGSNLNSAWFKGVPDDTFLGFDLELKVAGMATFFSDENKSFSTSGSFHFTDAQVDQILANSGITTSNPFYASTKSQMLAQEWEVTIAGPTIVGAEDEYVTVDFPSQTINGQSIAGYQVVLDGVNGFLNALPALPFMGAQLNIGTVYGTQASFRYFPEVDLEDLGKFKMVGFGIMHNVGMWFPNPLPIDLGVGFFTQTMDVGNTFSATSTQFGAFASKQFGAIVSITPYAGVTLESSKTTVKYDYTFDTPTGPTTSAIEMELEGENNLGITVGADIHLVFINLFVDYKMATYNTISGGVTLGF